ncbi:SGNH/GDSL hydrolase family protein [Niveibacterium sp. SC-1]|uniref:SGNH/GDSL hydrolase family protein n=1 Tax=Niveibacterium sp. SC-1 TaxID=3135646 RepID=UPI00311D5F0C
MLRSVRPLFLFCRAFTATFAVVLCLLAAQTALADGPPGASRWIASWTASPQAARDSHFVLPTGVPAELQDVTVRQFLRISLGGTRVRLRFSNAYGKAPLRIDQVVLAAPAREGASALARTLRFGGATQVSIAPGASVLSDQVALPLAPLTRLVVSLHLPASTAVETFHWDGRDTAWIARGELPLASAVQDDAQRITARLVLQAVEVAGDAGSGAVAVIGDSITDGNGASVDASARWPDFLAERLAPHGLAVINAGISGGRLLRDGMGESALARLERDVLAQPGVRALIVLIGINDIAWPGTIFDPQAQAPSVEALAVAYRELIGRAHARGLRVIGATLLPFAGALEGTPLADYHDARKDALRQAVNAWIRESGAFDAVVDLDAVTRDPADPLRLRTEADSGDHLHPGDAGNRMMAEAIPLSLLLSAKSPAHAR